MKAKKLFSILLVMLMLLSPLGLNVSAEGIEDALTVADNTSAEDKITDDLKAYLSTVEDDEYVPIYIWLNDYGEDTVYAVLSKKLGATITPDTEDSYIVNKIATKGNFLKENLETLSKTSTYSLQATATGTVDIKALSSDTFRELAAIPEIMTDTEIEKCISSGMSSEEIIALSERTQFLSDYRDSRKTVNTSVNNNFYSKLDLSKCKDVYLSSILTYVNMKCKKSYIDDLATLLNVSEIGYFYESTVFISSETDDSEDSDEITGIDSVAQDTTGYHMFPQETLGYNGAGMRIGAIEYSGNYDSDALHLIGKSITTKTHGDDSRKFHCNAVLSILGGLPISYTENGEELTYQGIAPEASLYLFSGIISEIIDDNYITWDVRLQEGLSWLFLDNSCHVVNMSMNIRESVASSYSLYDKILDTFVHQHRATIVTSAGNFEQVGGYGLAYNVITVGNASNIQIENKYLMNYDSSSNFMSAYYENDFLSNKPDISAFGTKIVMIDKDGVPSYRFSVRDPNNSAETTSGTSYSAPMVTGTVALMMQANPDLVGEPEVVKALIMGSADETAIYSDESNGIVEGTPTVYNVNDTVENTTNGVITSAEAILREKSGAGLLNIPAAIRMAIDDSYYRLNFYLDDLTGYDSWTSETVFLYEGYTLEAGLVVENFIDDTLTDKYPYIIDIQITDYFGNVLVETSGDINNVKMLKCTIGNDGYYRLGIKVNFPDTYIEGEVLHAAMFFTCGCTEKALETIVCTDSNRVIWCSNEECDFHYTESITTKSISETLSNGVKIKYIVSYKASRTNYAERDFAYYNYRYEITEPDGITVSSLMPGNGSYVQITETGEIRRYTYLAYIYENGVATEYSLDGVTITIDYFDRTIILS